MVRWASAKFGRRPEIVVMGVIAGFMPQVREESEADVLDNQVHMLNEGMTEVENRRMEMEDAR